MANWQCHNQMLPRNSDFSERLAFVFTKYLIGAKPTNSEMGYELSGASNIPWETMGKTMAKFHDLRMAELGTNILRT